MAKYPVYYDKKGVFRFFEDANSKGIEFLNQRTVRLRVMNEGCSTHKFFELPKDHTFKINGDIQLITEKGVKYAFLENTESDILMIMTERNPPSVPNEWKSKRQYPEYIIFKHFGQEDIQAAKDYVKDLRMKNGYMWDFPEKK